MLKTLGIKNLTVFPRAQFGFCGGVNVIIGENGSGKSHLLRTAYALITAGVEKNGPPSTGAPVKSTLQRTFAAKLVNVMRPKSLGRLTRRKTGRQRCEVVLGFADSDLDCAVSFTASSSSEVSIDHCPDSWQARAPAFLPPHELLTLYPGFLSVYEERYLEFDEIHRDTCILLGRPPLRSSGNGSTGEQLRQLEGTMGGKVELDPNGRFYLKTAGRDRMEMPLVAEGVRKLATLARLIANGSLPGDGYLFWDEPEANLNPKLIKSVAAAILSLSGNGVQVFVATHSLFLLRELEILAKTNAYKNVSQRYFALALHDDAVRVEQGDTADELQTLILLDEDLQQSDSYVALED